MTELTKRLTDYGADMPGAMERFVNDEALYAECFAIFLQDPCFAALGDALARGDRSAAFEAAHTLKGVSGNLGLTPLYEPVCALVELLRRNERGGLEAAYQAVAAAKAALDALNM